MGGMIMFKNSKKCVVSIRGYLIISVACYATNVGDRYRTDISMYYDTIQFYQRFQIVSEAKINFQSVYIVKLIAQYFK